MARQRNYATEYARRAARAVAEGARSFWEQRKARELAAPAPVYERTVRQETQRDKAFRALVDIEKGTSLSRAAKNQGTTPEQVRKYLGERLEPKERRWRLSEVYLERQGTGMNIFTLDGQKKVFISDPATRSEYATYLNYVKNYLYSLPDAAAAQSHLNYFKGRTFTDAAGNVHAYITDGKLLVKLYDDGKLKMEEFYAELSR